MNHKLYQIVSFAKHRLSSKNRHGVHSPFVYEMCDKVLRLDKKQNIHRSIEAERKAYLSTTEYIEVEDLGAGSQSGLGTKRSLKKIAKYSLSTPHQCRLMYRLVAFYQPSITIELGTSLGISTAYLGAANPHGLVYTFEGSESIFSQAQSLFQRLTLDNIQPILGSFDDRLPEILADLDKVDFAFIDGNHTYKSTLHYFQVILSKAHNDTLIVIDDIYWSEEMTKAWEAIKEDEHTTTTIDLFYCGIVLLRQEMSKEHFVLRY